MENLIKTINQTWFKQLGATSNQIDEYKRNTRFNLPVEYEEFLLWSNGGEGLMGNNYISFWPSEDVIRLNSMYRIDFYIPQTLGIATDGGDYCYALDYRTSCANPAFVLVPLGDLDVVSFIFVGSSFEGGLRNLLVSDFL